ncbi:putative uncharacterized protein [Firmicutes bacterium CAG:240]|nr:putative uncharacterized protein [Firmicutes bacterium CAG:240]
MKKIGSFNLGLAFAGCFLGAGYVSGQELWQFFGSFGAKGVAGLLLAVALLFFTGIIMILLGRLTKLSEIDKIVVRRDWPLLRGAVTVLELLFLFGVGTIMSAGVGALLEQLFGLAPFIGSAVFAALVAVVSLAGFSGMVSAFSATVPVLSVVTLVFGIMSVCTNGLVLPQSGGGSNPLMSSWLVAAVSFACYNVFGSIAMIAPLGPYVKSKKAAVGGIAIGACVLLLIAGSVLVSVSAAPETADAQLPMLALAHSRGIVWVAQSRGIVWGYVYGVLLLLAMFGTALSSLVAFVSMLAAKSARISGHKNKFTALCALCMFLGSLFGFGDLIGVVYPIFGYCSSVFIVLMAVHYFKVKKQNAQKA